VLVLSVVSILLCAWAPTFDLFVASFFCAGFFLFGYETTVYIYISEISGKEWAIQRCASRRSRSTC
jgi:MFS family permease